MAEERNALQDELERVSRKLDHAEQVRELAYTWGVWLWQRPPFAIVQQLLWLQTHARSADPCVLEEPSQTKTRLFSMTACRRSSPPIFGFVSYHCIQTREIWKKVHKACVPDLQSGLWSRYGVALWQTSYDSLTNLEIDKIFDVIVLLVEEGSLSDTTP